jgi:hypothetical protein
VQAPRFNLQHPPQPLQPPPPFQQEGVDKNAPLHHVDPKDDGDAAAVLPPLVQLKTSGEMSSDDR